MPKATWTVNIWLGGPAGLNVAITPTFLSTPANILDVSACSLCLDGPLKTFKSGCVLARTSVIVSALWNCDFVVVF